MSERYLMLEQDGERYAIPESVLAEYRLSDEGQAYFDEQVSAARDQSVVGHGMVGSSMTQSGGGGGLWSSTPPPRFGARPGPRFP